MTLKQIRVKQVLTRILNEYRDVNTNMFIILKDAQDGTIPVAKARRLLAPMIERGDRLSNWASKIRYYYDDWKSEDWFYGLCAYETVENNRYAVMLNYYKN